MAKGQNEMRVITFETKQVTCLTSAIPDAEQEEFADELFGRLGAADKFRCMCDFFMIPYTRDIERTDADIPKVVAKLNKLLDRWAKIAKVEVREKPKSVEDLMTAEYKRLIPGCTDEQARAKAKEVLKGAKK